ncbi:hypothetical protein [Bradyrhizobium sp. RT7b]|uniref:hypothetical protein n=1 Tax=unclassified Bradyrhizobium TaxID=2631580 RepID=UPI003392E583
MTNVPQIRGLTFVLIGEFNPTIFQPAWFASENLLTEEEASAADVSVIHPDITAFELPWIRIQVERERVSVTSLAQPYFERAAATVCDTFAILKHTPVRLFGVNNEAHYRASTADKWHALGHKLVPKDYWRTFFSNPGMQNVSIRQVPRDDGLGGHTQIVVEPSVKVQPGVYIATNDEIRNADGSFLGAARTVELIQEKWPSLLEFSETVFSSIAEEIA